MQSCIGSGWESEEVFVSTTSQSAVAILVLDAAMATMFLGLLFRTPEITVQLTKAEQRHMWFGCKQTCENVSLYGCLNSTNLS